MDPAETTATIARTQGPRRPGRRTPKPGSFTTPTASSSPPPPERPRPRTGSPTRPGPRDRPRTGRCGSPGACDEPRRHPGCARRGADPRRAGRGHPPRPDRAPRRPRPRHHPTRPSSTCSQLAADHDAKALKQLGRHILEVASPDAADAHEAKLLEREERDAAAATRLTMWDDGRGKVHGRFTLDALTGAMLKKALHAYAAPKHRAAKGPARGATADPGAARPRLRRDGPALPRQEAPQSRRPQRHRRGSRCPSRP